MGWWLLSKTCVCKFNRKNRCAAGGQVAGAITSIRLTSLAGSVVHIAQMWRAVLTIMRLRRKSARSRLVIDQRQLGEVNDQRPSIGER